MEAMVLECLCRLEGGSEDKGAIRGIRMVAARLEELRKQKDEEDSE
jgi:hypothetical protein